ncbi:MAG: aspartate carbamoyltransferase [Clostridiales bacterium]|nr:aspartate carbamoyltransferase [Clostridiales bacterium]
MRHLITAKNLTPEYIDALIADAGDIIKNPAAHASSCAGKILAALFYESSTRTRLSFESAMLRLGGSVIGFESSGSSSASKGESVADTIRIVSSYADVCAIRHPKEGAALVASRHALIPVINAGDGGHQHPTQTLTDLMTIYNVKGRLDRLTIGFCGDLKFGRTVHSLISACVKYHGVSFILVSPRELKLPGYVREEIEAAGAPCAETDNLGETIADMDVLYMTRVQRERFFNEEDYVRLKDTYILNKQKLASARPDLAVMHPLPRVNEISTEIDRDPRALYFKQAEYGCYIRMALIKDLLKEARG